MKSFQFAEAYEQQKPWIGHDSHPVRGELLLQGAEKSAGFSNALLSYLRGVRLTDEEASQLFNSYKNWLNFEFADMVYDKPSLFDDEPDEETFDRFYDEIAFHATNTCTLNIWQRLLTGKQPTKAEIEASQINLACLSIMQARPAALKHKAGELYRTRGDAYTLRDSSDRGLMALATQLDAMVAYLELMKSNPDLVVVPAPPQFENSTINTDLNSDLIAINTEDDTAHGIQVKINLRASKKRQTHYDDNYVAMLDGMNDLKNFVFMRKSSGSESVAVPMPGIYSAHFLIGKKQLFRFGLKKGTGVMQHESAHRLAITRQMAFALADMAPSVNTQVNQRLSDIALQKLIER